MPRFRPSPVPRSLLASLLAALGMFLFLDAAFPHDPGLSRLVLVVEDGSITADVELAREDAAALERSAGPSWPLEALEVRADGTAAAPELLEAVPRDGGALEVVLRFRAERPRRLEVRSRMLASLPRGHRQVAAVARRDGSRLAARILHGGEDRIECESGGAAGPEERPSFAGFLSMGLEHILDGWDHLLFLLALLLGARTFLQGLKLITAFSAAHSMTLALSALEVVSLHPRIVEPLIAASIVHAGAANLFGRRAGAGAGLAFAFGLVHGLGFSHALCEAGIQPGWAAALPLLGFNAGVELGQAAVAALVFPWIVRLRPSPAFSARFAPALSALIAACGAVWLIERTLF